MSNTPTPMASSRYLRFLSVALTHAKEAPMSQLDANETAVLEAIAIKEYEGESLKITDAMSISSLGAPATLHRRIARLRKLGAVSVVTDPVDSRIKTLVVTDAVRNYFERMGQAILDLDKT